MVSSGQHTSDFQSNSSSDTDPEYVLPSMFQKKPKKRFKTTKVQKKYRWISPGYINFLKPVKFQKIEKETVIKLSEIIPDDLIKDKFINDFYITSRKPTSKGKIKILWEGQSCANEIF